MKVKTLLSLLLSIIFSYINFSYFLSHLTWVIISIAGRNSTHKTLTIERLPVRLKLIYSFASKKLSLSYKLLYYLRYKSCLNFRNPNNISKLHVLPLFLICLYHVYRCFYTFSWLVVWVLWHINHCRLFNTKSIFMKIVLFQTIQFSISAQFKCKYTLIVKNTSISRYSV